MGLDYSASFILNQTIQRKRSKIVDHCFINNHTVALWKWNHLILASWNNFHPHLIQNLSTGFWAPLLEKQPTTLSVQKIKNALESNTSGCKEKSNSVTSGGRHCETLIPLPLDMDKVTRLVIQSDVDLNYSSLSISRSPCQRLNNGSPAKLH